MNLGLLDKCLMTYGATISRGKAAAVILLLSGGIVMAEPVRLVAFGDSLTQGYGLPVDQGFVPQLEQWLSARGADVELVNAGVSGDTTAAGAARVEWTLNDGFDAMIVAFGGNDLLRGIDPANSRANIRIILEAAQHEGVQVLLVGMDAPGNYGADYRAAFDAIYPELAAEFGTLYFANFFTGLGEGSPASLRKFVQADGLHPKAQGVVLIVDAMGPTVLELVQNVRRSGS